MSDWNSLPLGELVSFQKGKKVETSSFLRPGYCRYLGARSLSGKHDGYGSTYMSVQASSKDILMLWDGERSGLVAHNLDGVVSSTVSKLTVNEKIISEYLYYFLLHNFSWIQNNRTGTGIPHVPKDLGRILIVDYPIDKSYQKKVSSILRDLDLTIKKTEECVEKYQKIKTGLMQDLFTRGVGVDGKLRPTREQAPELYHETKIGWIPNDWKATKLKDILLRTGGYLQTGPFGSQLHAHEYTYEGVPVIMPQDINNGLVHEKQIARITKLRANSLIRHRLKVGDIIIARRGELSRSAAITENEKGWVCGTGCFLMRLGGTGLNSQFISYTYRHSMVQRQVEGLAVGSTMPSLNNEIMGKLIFPDMDSTEQSEISSRIQILEDKVATLQAEKIKLVHLKSGLMNDLLTGKKPVSADELEAMDV